MRRRARPRLVLGRDYTLDERGRAIFSREYLLSLGTCCGNGCLNCPYPHRDARDRRNADLPDHVAPAQPADPLSPGGPC